MKTYPKRTRILSNLKQIIRITSSPKVEVKLPDFVLINARSLAPKLDELEDLVLQVVSVLRESQQFWT